MTLFDMPTNFTMGNETTAVNGIGSLFKYGSYVTNGWFGTGLVIMIFLISFVGTSLMNVGRAFAASAFIAFVFSVYFARIQAVSPTVPIILLVATIVGFFWAKSERGQY